MAISAIEKRVGENPKKLNKIKYLGHQRYQLFYQLRKGSATVTVYVRRNGKGGMIERILI